mmetsp:Transcript_7898/g.23774  ORF Transcript_7898/g.23774 Transcript_7898/m.23774 type:complete len:122 (-) Transcript_7898:281-646(-)
MRPRSLVLRRMCWNADSSTAMDDCRFRRKEEGGVGLLIEAVNLSRAALLELDLLVAHNSNAEHTRQQLYVLERASNLLFLPRGTLLFKTILCFDKLVLSISNGRRASVQQSYGHGTKPEHS